MVSLQCFRGGTSGLPTPRPAWGAQTVGKLHRAAPRTGAPRLKTAAVTCWRDVPGSARKRLIIYSGCSHQGGRAPPELLPAHGSVLQLLHPPQTQPWDDGRYRVLYKHKCMHMQRRTMPLHCCSNSPALLTSCGPGEPWCTAGAAAHNWNTRATPSSPPLSTHRPSQLNPTSCTAAPWPPQSCTAAPVRRSHTRTRPSRQALATSGCDACQARRVTPSGCAHTLRWLKVAASQMMSLPSMLPDAARLAAALKPAASTLSSWAAGQGRAGGRVPGSFRAAAVGGATGCAAAAQQQHRQRLGGPRCTDRAWPGARIAHGQVCSGSAASRPGAAVRLGCAQRVGGSDKAEVVNKVIQDLMVQCEHHHQPTSRGAMQPGEGNEQRVGGRSPRPGGRPGNPPAGRVATTRPDEMLVRQSEPSTAPVTATWPSPCTARQVRASGWKGWPCSSRHARGEGAPGGRAPPRRAGRPRGRTSCRAAPALAAGGWGCRQCLC